MKILNPEMLAHREFCRQFFIEMHWISIQDVWSQAFILLNGMKFLKISFHTLVGRIALNLYKQHLLRRGLCIFPVPAQGDWHTCTNIKFFLFFAFESILFRTYVFCLTEEMSGVSKICAREIFDSRGNPTVEVDITTSKGK